MKKVCKHWGFWLKSPSNHLENKIKVILKEVQKFIQTSKLILTDGL